MSLACGWSRGITKAGVGVVSVNAEITTGEELKSILQSCSGFVVGSPTLGGHMPTPVKVMPLKFIRKKSNVCVVQPNTRSGYHIFWCLIVFCGHQDAMGVILQDVDARPKPCGVFGSFGWSGEAIDEMEQLLKDGGFKFAFPTMRCKFKVSNPLNIFPFDYLHSRV